MRLHVFGLPHSQIRKDLPWAFCAYSQKIFNICKMFYDEGHEVFLYANGESTAPCTELIDYFPKGMFEEVHGPITPTSRPEFGPGVTTYEWAKDNFANEVNKRLDKNDIVLSTFGDPYHGELFKGCKAPVVESAIGYPYCHHAHYQVWESSYLRNFVLGREKNEGPNFSHEIIHGYIDPEEYIFNKYPKDYFLYLARVEDNYAYSKGLHLAIDIAKKTGIKLKIAGPGPGEKYVEKNIEYVGPVAEQEKAALIANAKGLFSLSLYPEPFGYIVIESLISGTPVITTNHGAFPETVKEGVTGFRGTFFNDFVEAVNNIDTIDRQVCRDYAMEHFSLKSQYKHYNKFFKKVLNAEAQGYYYTPSPDIVDPEIKSPTIIAPKKKKLKIHMIGAPHMNVMQNKLMATCAYSTKIYLICKKLVEEGHEVVHYGVEGNECPCTENVAYVSKAAWEESHGQRNEETYHDFGMHLRSYKEGSEALLPAVTERFKNDGTEVILSTFGPWCPQLQQLPGAVIEWGIGYDWAWSRYKVFESYAWQHVQYRGLGSNYDITGCKWYDAVIPGYVDKDQFTYSANKEGYLLFLGRIMNTKGINMAIDLALKYGTPLKIAGNGDVDFVKKYENMYPNIIEYVGVAGVKEKRELFSKAKATLCMTQYTEPFGNVHIESMMSGTPVITTDWGVYTETVPNGLVGFRGRTFEDHCYAIEQLDRIRPQTCRDWAEANFSLEAVYEKFITYFEKCALIEKEGNEKEDHYKLEINSGKPGSYSKYSERFNDYWPNYLDFIKNKKGVI